MRGISFSTSPAAKRAGYARTMLVLWSVTAVALEALRLHGLGPSDVGLRPPRHGYDIAAALAAIGILLAATGAMRGSVPKAYARRLSPLVPGSRGDWIWFVPLAASAGICEEFLYRGYLLSQVAQLTGSVAAGVVIATAAFGLAHAYQGRLGMIGTSLSGLLYCIIYLWSGSLVPCMIAHFAHDLTGAGLLARQLRAQPPSSDAADLGTMPAEGGSAPRKKTTEKVKASSEDLR